MNSKQFLAAEALSCANGDNPSYVDVGALFLTVGETISTAAKRTTDLTIIDLWDGLWPKMQDHLHKRGVDNCEYICEDILDYSGRSFDIVFCSGVIYHMPDPSALWDKFDQICKSQLVVQSLICDFVNDRRIPTVDNPVICKRAHAYFRRKLHPDLPYVFPPHKDKYAPIYWLYSPEVLLAEARAHGWNVRLSLNYTDLVFGMHLTR